MEESKKDKLEKQLINFDVKYDTGYPYQMMVLDKDWKPVKTKTYKSLNFANIKVIFDNEEQELYTNINGVDISTTNSKLIKEDNIVYFVSNDIKIPVKNI